MLAGAMIELGGSLINGRNFLIRCGHYVRPSLRKSKNELCKIEEPPENRKKNFPRKNGPPTAVRRRTAMTESDDQMDCIDETDRALGRLARHYRHLSMHRGDVPMVRDQFGRCAKCVMLKWRDMATVWPARERST